MRKFRKKPVECECWLWDENQVTLRELIAAGMKPWSYESGLGIEHIRNLRIQTLEGNMLASHGDWIVKGVAGEFWPVKPDIFAQTYEEVVE